MAAVIVAVLGAGGHGHDIRAIAEAAGHGTYFLDDRWKPSHRIAALGFDSPYVVGVNSPATKRRLAVGSNPVTLVHPTATVDPSTIIGRGCVIGAGTHIGPDCLIGDHVHIGPGCTLTRTEIGSFTTISPGVDIAGDCTVGFEVLIGVGARIANLRNVWNRATVGAGAVVVRDVMAGETVVCRDLTATGAKR